MRKILLFLLIVIISGCSGEEEKKVSDNNETLVFGKSNKVSVMIDKDWRVVPSDDLELCLVGRGKHNIEFSLIPAGESFDRATDKILDEYKKKKNFILDTKSDVGVDSIPSLYIFLEYQDGDENITENLYLVPQGEKMLLIRVKAPLSDFDDVFVEDLLDTMTIMDKTAKVKEKATERPLFFPEKVLEKLEVYSKDAALSHDIIGNLGKVFDGMVKLDDEFKKTKEFSIFSRRKTKEVNEILKNQGFNDLKDYEDKINKSIAALMVINYTAEFKDKVSEVELNLVKELVQRNSLSYSDIKLVYSNYNEVLKLERKMRL